MSHRIRVIAVSGLLLMLALPKLAFASEKVLQEIELCDFNVSEQIARANASFSVIYALHVGDDGQAVKVEKVKNDFLNDEAFVSCLKRWTLPARNQRLIVTFNWKHGLGWTEITISGPAVNQRIRIQPGAFKQY